ncbi:unnamed protein product, partial [marine sediment metagenome]
DATSDVLHVYGDDDAIMDINVNSSALTLTVYDKTDNNDVLDALQRLDPANSGDKIYNWNNVYPTTVWVNRKDTDNEKYTRSFFYKNWLPTPASPAGDASAKGTRTLAGNSEVVAEYNQPVIGEKLAMASGANSSLGGHYGGDAAATLTYTPTEVPKSGSGMYAIRVVAIEEHRSGDAITLYEEEDLTITTSMVSSAGIVTIDSTDMKILDGIQYAYVNYLYDRDALGIYP